jgi:hypothetical protein
MAEPIANDWKAIRARMQQIKLEEAGLCRRCGGTGWMPVRASRLNRNYVYGPCDACGNPNDLPFCEVGGGASRHKALG